LAGLRTRKPKIECIFRGIVIDYPLLWPRQELVATL
jgi:hypothetical protein